MDSGACVTFSYLQLASAVSAAGNRPFFFFPSEVGRAASVSSSKKRASRFHHTSCTCSRQTWREMHNEKVEVRASVAVSQGQMSGVNSKLTSNHFYYRMGQVFFPPFIPYLLLIITLPSEGQGG